MPHLDVPSDTAAPVTSQDIGGERVSVSVCDSGGVAGAGQDRPRSLFRRPGRQSDTLLIGIVICYVANATHKKVGVT